MKAGDRVSSGVEGSDDYDTGTVVTATPGEATVRVRWDLADVVYTEYAAGLKPLPEPPLTGSVRAPLDGVFERVYMGEFTKLEDVVLDVMERKVSTIRVPKATLSYYGGMLGQRRRWVLGWSHDSRDYAVERDSLSELVDFAAAWKP